MLSKTRIFSECRFWASAARGKSCARAGMEVSRLNDFSAKLTQAEFAKTLKPIPISPDEIKLRLCK